MLGHRERECRVLWAQSRVPASAGTTFGSAPEPPSSLKAMASATAPAVWRYSPQYAAPHLLLSSLAADRRPWLILEYTEVWPGVCQSIAPVSHECLRCAVGPGARL